MRVTDPTLSLMVPGRGTWYVWAAAARESRPGSLGPAGHEDADSAPASLEDADLGSRPLCSWGYNRDVFSGLGRVSRPENRRFGASGARNTREWPRGTGATEKCVPVVLPGVQVA